MQLLLNKVYGLYLAFLAFVFFSEKKIYIFLKFPPSQ